MTRWIMTIQEYDFTIRYIKASNNKIADTLSRYAPEFVEEHKSEPVSYTHLDVYKRQIHYYNYLLTLTVR